jgi:hypothetical protein
MPDTIGEVINQIHGYKLKAAVYNELTVYLQQFITTDTHTPSKGVKAPVGPDEIVPESVVEGVLDELLQFVSEIHTEIEDLSRHSVGPKKAKTARKKAKPPRRRTNAKKKASAKARKK